VDSGRLARVAERGDARWAFSTVSRRLALAFLAIVLFGLLPGASLVQLLPEADAEALKPLEANPSDRIGLARVTVRDMEGRPLKDAVVRAIVVRDGVAYLAGRAVSGPDGVVRLEGLTIGAHWFLAEAHLRARTSTQRFIGPDPIDLELRLAAERALVVEVRDERGKPVIGAEIEVRGADPLPKGARTGKDGFARPTGLGAGPLRVTARASGYDETTASIGSSETRVRIVLRRLGTLTVTVIDPDGRGAEGATVSIAGGLLSVPRSTTAGKDGIARIGGLAAGSYDLRATKGMLVAAPDIGVLLARGADATARLVLVAGRSLLVHVVDDEGRVVPSAEIVVVEGGISPFPLLATTDSKGDATISPIAPGAAALGAHATGYVPRGPIALPLDGSPLTVVLRRAATLLGDVRDARGIPVDGATIEVVGTDLDGLPISATPASLGFQSALFARGAAGGRTLIPMGELGVVPGPVPPIPKAGGFGAAKALGGPAFEPWVTRADGTFTATPVPAGRLRAIVRHPAYVEAISEPVDVAPAGEGHVKVVLAAGGRLFGRVRDEKGFSVAGALVEVAARKGSMSRSVRTASDGTYVLAAVPGEISLNLSAPDRPNDIALRMDVSVPEGGSKELDLVLPAPRPNTKVHVIDDRRYPVKGAQVTVASLDPTAPSKTTSFTDDRGDAEIARIAGLKVQIEVRAPGHAPYRQVHEALATALEVELAQGILVKGVVYAPGGRTSLAGASVVLFGDGGVRRAASDAEGRFQFADVPRGDATIEVRAPATAFVRKAIAVAMTGSRAETDLGRIELGAAGIVEGTVVDEKGKGVAGARVARDRAPTWIPAGGAGPGVAITDSTGAFKLLDVAVGEPEIEAYSPDRGRGRSDKVRVDEGRTTPGVKIVLHPSTSAGGGDDLAPGGVAVTLGEGDGKVLVVAVAAGSEAERAGMLEGDEILAVEGKPVSTMAEARSRLSGPLTDVIVRVKRAGGERSLRIPREATRR